MAEIANNMCFGCGASPCITPEVCEKKRTELINQLHSGGGLWIPASEVPLYQQLKKKMLQDAFFRDDSIHQMD